MGGMHNRVNYLSHDFTLEKYGELCQALFRSGYTPRTICEYLEGGWSNSRKTVLIRHDIDRKITTALRMAEFEHSVGIRSTYYFRHPHTFQPDIIKATQDLGHEVGYHYETLSKAKGDQERAIRLFEKELSAFREIPDCRIATICMHGSPLSRYDNRDLWINHNFREFGLRGEAYLSVQGTRYFTDTGRSWNSKYSIWDMMPGGSGRTDLTSVETTDDLIGWIGSCGEECLYLTVHPERWALDEGEWAIGSVLDFIKNSGKRVIAAMR